MGPIMHRKRVLSMPLCSDASNDFFLPPSLAPTIIEEIVGEDGTVGSSSSQVQSIQHQAAAAANAAARPRNPRMRQNTAPISGRGFFDTSSSAAPHNEASATSGRRSSPRKKTNSFMANILARRAVAMDLLPANDADLGMYEFFHPMERGTAATTTTVPVGLEQYGEETKEEEEGDEGGGDLETGVAAVDVVGAAEEDEEEMLSQSEEEKAKKKKKLFKPLIFAPRRMMPGGGGGGHGHHGGGGHGGHPHGGGGAFCDIVASTTQDGQDEDAKPVDIIISDKDDKDGTILDASEAVPLTTAKSEDEEEEDMMIRQVVVTRSITMILSKMEKKMMMMTK